MNNTAILRARIAAQGLTSLHDAVSPALARHGFVRTLGGVDGYLVLRNRVAGFRAADLDSALMARDGIVMPAARGCMYVVAREHAPAALRLAAELTLPRAEKDQARAGIAPGEVAALGDVVLATLAKLGPATTDGLKRVLPAGAVRSLGEVGKKAGVSSTLPPALRLLELEGRVERTPDGSIHTGNYRWQVARENLLARGPRTKADALEAMVALYARAAALVTTKAFADWAGVPQRDASVAVAAAGLTPISYDDKPAFLHPDARDADVSNVIAFLTFEDNLFELESGLAPFVDPAYHGIEVPTWVSAAKTSQTIAEARHPFYRSLLVADRVVGFWDWSPRDARVVIGTFAPLSKALAKKVRGKADELGAFIRDELGDGRSVSVESDIDLQRRADHVTASFNAR